MMLQSQTLTARKLPVLSEDKSLSIDSVVQLLISSSHSAICLDNLGVDAYTVITCHHLSYSHLYLKA